MSPHIYQICVLLTLVILPRSTVAIDQYSRKVLSPSFLHDHVVGRSSAGFSGEHWKPTDTSGSSGSGSSGSGSSGSGSSGSHTGGHHASPSTVSIAMASMLMGMTAVIMSLFYLVNYPDEDIKMVTWHCLSSTISLFCAVLMFTSMKATMVILFHEDPNEKEGIIPDEHSLMLAFGRFACIFLLFQAFLVLLRKTDLPLKSVAHLGSHVAGFAAIEAFGFALDHYFAYSPYAVWFGLCVMGTAMNFCNILGRGFRYAVVSKETRESHHFQEVCCDGEFQFTSLSFGMLFSMAVRRSITGYMPSLHGSPGGKSFAEIWTLFAVAMGFEITLIILVLVAHYWDTSDHSDTAIYWVRLTLRIVGMIVGWLLLFWGEWLFWSQSPVDEEHMMIAKCTTALIFSLMAFTSFFVTRWMERLLYIERHALRGIVSSFALLLGLSWESVFQTAIGSVGALFEDRPALQIEAYIGLSTFLCVVVLPAWVLYILPKSDDGVVDDCGLGHEEDRPTTPRDGVTF